MLLKELTLFSNDIEGQTRFYQDVLGIPPTSWTENEVRFEIGVTSLKFVLKDDATPYHFAFNIPSNKIHEAIAWLRKKVDILTFEDKELVDFPRWNAHAVYFYDSDLNIVELIARHNQQVFSGELFHAGLMLCVSEIGVPVNNIETVYKFLHGLFGIPIYSGDFSRFCAMGGEDALFIVIDKKTKPGWFPTGDIAYSSDFLVTVDATGREFTVAFENETLRLLK